MSFISPTSAIDGSGVGSAGLASAGLGSTSLPAISEADLPASVRSGSPAEKSAYTEALGFEQILVNELSQQLSATVSSDDGSDGTDGTDGSDGSSGSGSDDSSMGLLSAGTEASGFASLIPQAMTQSIMAGGGLGEAFTTQLADSIDPSLRTAK